VQPAFCALTLNALDDRPIGTASRLLLTAGATVSNTAMRWDERRTTLEDWGRSPVCIEAVTGTVVLRGLEGAKEVSAQPLDGAGRPLGAPLALVRVEGEWRLAVGAPATVWYVVNVTR
jgi:hypothetical protein